MVLVDLWVIITATMMMFTEIMKTDLVLEIIVQITQSPNYKKVVEMVVQEEFVAPIMLAILVMAEMSTGMIRAIEEGP